MGLAKGMTIEVASMKAGMSEKTGRKYKRVYFPPDEIKKAHIWRTRKDSFEAVWPLIVEKLKINIGLEAKTLFEWLQNEYPGKFQDGQLRTLQRKIKLWRAIEGPPKEVMFSQVHYPGDLCESDFTNMNDLDVTIDKAPFKHIIYHFVLTYSNWEHITICFSESFESLSEGLQNALWNLGGVPKRHRTDRLSAAVNNNCSYKKFTLGYESLLQHYGLSGEKIQAGKAHENGDIEQRHHRFKRAVQQALFLRGNSDFINKGEYESFLKKIVAQLNEGRSDRVKEEVEKLRELPFNRLEACKRYKLKVGPSSTINLIHNTYSVHSRLIGEIVEARLYSDSIDIWYGQQRVDELPRIRGEYKYLINYRHIIDWLVRKPGAFENYRYKAALFPNSHFRMAYDHLKKEQPINATKEYLKILQLAAKESESKVINALNILFDLEEPVSHELLCIFVFSKQSYDSSQEVCISNPNLKDYDNLLIEREGMVCN